MGIFPWALSAPSWLGDAHWLTRPPGPRTGRRPSPSRPSRRRRRGFRDRSTYRSLPATPAVSLRCRWSAGTVSSTRKAEHAGRSVRRVSGDPGPDRFSGGVLCRGPGPLITPDLVLFRSDRTLDRADDLRQIVGIEVKKLERTARGTVARASGADFNTTPPCGRIRVYDANDDPMDVRGFYLFVCLEPADRVVGAAIVSSLALVDGNFLNEDFAYYLSITGQREKRIGLGTFSDGADRQRPMLIFPNPLGIAELDHSATLVHSDLDLTSPKAPLIPRSYLRRRVPSTDEVRTFIAYRHAMDATTEPPTDMLDPFPTPRRTTRTVPRGRFRLPFAF